LIVTVWEVGAGGSNTQGLFCPKQKRDMCFEQNRSKTRANHS
jgi:hypothetical protein